MRTKIFKATILILALVASKAYEHGYSKQEIQSEVDSKIIYYGSTVRLQNQANNFHLHSHELRYGTGSGQQSVTGMQDDNDYNSLWIIKGAHDGPIKFYDNVVKCGDTIRLEHSLTGRNLHSHDFRSPVTGKFEVSAFGESGSGDTGDDWILKCDDKSDGTTFRAQYPFDLQHNESKRYLIADKNNQFNRRNCGQQCPIMGQLEIACEGRQSANGIWKITSGVFFNHKEEDLNNNDHDEHHDDDL